MDDLEIFRMMARCEDKEQMMQCVNEFNTRKAVTNGEYIRSMLDKDLANLLASLAYGRETPWSEPFDKKFCRNCPTVEGTIQETGQTMDFHECDFADGECPHGSDIEWWLQQPREEPIQKRYVFGGYRDLNSVAKIVKEDT